MQTRTLILVLLATALFPVPVLAARVYVDPASVETGQEGRFVASVLVDTEGEPLNSYEGILVYPEELLTVESVSDGNSVVGMWLERPTDSGGSVRFSGITPGGYAGARGILFTVTFRTKGTGQGIVAVESARVFLHDGSGTEARVASEAGAFTVTLGEGTGDTLVDDTDPPEPFTVELARSDDAFDSQWFIAFATQDKGSGVRGYQVCEGLWGGCRDAESPWVLENQERDSLIRVKATDNAGNTRSETLYTSKAVARYSAVLAALILIGVLVLALVRRRP